MVKNKKGWIKIVEAFIAILLIMSVMLGIYSTNRPKPENIEVQKLVDSIVQEISSNDNLRQDILNNNPDNIKPFVAERLPSFLNFTIKICEIDDVCTLPQYKQEVYAKERIISANLTTFNPKKVKLFVWEK